MIVDFSSLSLPETVRRTLADAFWNHYGARPPHSALHSWHRLNVFARFVAETNAVRGLADLNGDLLARYIEWLNAQCAADGTPWSKATRCAIYGPLRRLLQWIERCRPGLLSHVEYPFNPFPFRNRDRCRRVTADAQDLRALLRACEHDIAQTREEYRCANEERAMARSMADPLAGRGALLNYIDHHFAGILPHSRALLKDHYRCYQAIKKYGGRESVARCMYPRIDSVLPYYLAIVLHSAGNAEAIAQLTCDCLQSVPLLEDRELLIWAKPRAAAAQRRAFRRTASFEPPVLVRELREWTHRLRPHARSSERDQLFLLHGATEVRSLARTSLMHPLRRFEARHGLKHIVPASVRPSVLTSLYRSSGDLRQVKIVANHAQLSTTIGYVQAPEVEAQNRTRIATLQRAFIGHIEGVSHARAEAATAPREPKIATVTTTTVRAGAAVSMFGFDCSDPLAGIAPGTRPGELCSNFLGCFTCPNAIIPRDASTLARLLQARDHLRAAAAVVHPARWQMLYDAPLKILEEDVLTRFSARELTEAGRLQASLAPLAPLR